MGKKSKKNLPISVATASENSPSASMQQSNALIKNGKRQPLIFIFLFLGLASFFLALPVSQVTDSQFSLLLSRTMAFEHSTRLDPYLNREQFKPSSGFFYWYWQLSPERNGKVITQHSGDWVEGEALYYRYPNLPSALAIPFVVVAEKMGLSVLDERGFYHHRHEVALHRLIAALLSAGIVVLIYRLGLLLLPTYWAFIVALVLGLGTQIISTLSRGVWSDTWAVIFAILAIHQLLAHQLGRIPFRPIYLVGLSALAFFCKPNYAVVGVVVLGYALKMCTPWQLRLIVGVGGACVLGFVGYSLWQFGTIIPDYYVPAIALQYLPTAFVGHLFSPSRGILVYSPFLMVILWGAWYFRKSLGAPLLIRWSWLAMAILMLVSSAWGTWWGGHSYGPRLITPLVPWLTLLTLIVVESFGRSLDPKAPSFDAYRQAPGNYSQAFRQFSRAPKTCATFAIGAIISLMIHIHGANDPKTWLEWFYKPYPVFNNPQARLWDWSDAQWLAGIKCRSYESTSRFFCWN